MKKWKVVIGSRQFLVDGEDHHEATTAAARAACEVSGVGFDYLIEANPEDITTINAQNKVKENK